ncbi:hypothetical protein GCM10010106_35350 [Thermopolyspora flexuosa]|nr:hypothetical protein GCM10010106_35350 [Thermopolyspora flexuosa]
MQGRLLTGRGAVRLLAAVRPAVLGCALAGLSVRLAAVRLAVLRGALAVRLGAVRLLAVLRGTLAGLSVRLTAVRLLAVLGCALRGLCVLRPALRRLPVLLPALRRALLGPALLRAVDDRPVGILVRWIWLVRGIVDRHCLAHETTLRDARTLGQAASDRLARN